MPQSVTEDVIPLPVVLYVDDLGLPDLIDCIDQKDADAEEYHLRFVKGKVTRHEELSVHLKDLFPEEELYTLFSGETKTCCGLYRTEDDATAANKELHKGDYPKYAVLKIEFNE